MNRQRCAFSGLDAIFEMRPFSVDRAVEPCEKRGIPHNHRPVT